MTEQILIGKKVYSSEKRLDISNTPEYISLVREGKLVLGKGIEGGKLDIYWVSSGHLMEVRYDTQRISLKGNLFTMPEAAEIAERFFKTKLTEIDEWREVYEGD